MEYLRDACRSNEDSPESSSPKQKFDGFSKKKKMQPTSAMRPPDRWDKVVNVFGKHFEFGKKNA